MAKLVECKTCKLKVDPSAKTCPNCGAKNPDINGRQGCLGILVFAIFFAGFMANSEKQETKTSEQSESQKSEPVAQAEQSNTNPPEIKGGTAKGYEVVSADDLSNGYRKRHRWFIVSDAAQTFEDRAATVIKAAIDLKKQTRTQEAFIVMDISKEFAGKGEVVAMADYIYDSKDAPWKVQSSDVAVKKPLNKNAMPFILLKEVK
jgi:hypothetical protein